METENHDRKYEIVILDSTDFPIEAQFFGNLNLSVSFKKVLSKLM